MGVYETSSTVIAQKQHEAVIDWVESNRGKAVEPKYDALKCLEEMLEMCFDAGASAAKVRSVVETEIHKAAMRGNADGGNPDYIGVSEEMGDVYVTLSSMAHKYNIDVATAVDDVMHKLAKRSWSVNEVTGILERPRR